MPTLLGINHSFSDSASWYWTGNSTSIDTPIITYQTINQGTQPIIYSTNTFNTNNYNSYSQLRQLTPEELEEHARKAEEDKKDAARAKQLMFELLDSRQKFDYLKHQHFDVILDPSTVYRIKKGSAGNVYLLDKDGKKKHKYCIHAKDALPCYDNMVAQKLMLETDEEKFLEIANRHW